MKTKQLVLMIIFIFLMLSICTAKNKADSPYLKGLKNLLDDDNIFMQIVYQKKYLKFNNAKIELYGYINKIDSRIYLSPNFDDPLLNDKGFRGSESILLFIDYQNKKLLDIEKCKANDSLIEIHGTFHIQKAVYKDEYDLYYLTNIEKIYDFDTRPINNGGMGKRYRCYPEVDLKDSSLK